MSVLYVVFRAFSYDLPYLELLCMQTMLQASVCFVPLPGASGAQELGFSMFFSSYFASGDVLYTAVLVWRFFTYYIVVILGALLVVADQIVWPPPSPEGGKLNQPPLRAACLPHTPCAGPAACKGVFVQKY